MSSLATTIIQATGEIPTSTADIARLFGRIESAFLGLLYVLFSLILNFLDDRFPPGDSPMSSSHLAERHLIYWEDDRSDVSTEYGDWDIDAGTWVPLPKPKLMPIPRAPPFVADPARRSGQSIPVDIYLHIIPLLSKADQITLLRVCRLTHFLIAPIVYPILHTTLHIDLSKDINPVVIRGVPIPPRQVRVPTGDYDVISPIHQSVVGTTVRKALPHQSLPNRFEYTTFLTLTSHTRPACRGLSLDMPNLDTLRVEPLGSEEDLILCRCCPGSYAAATPLTTGTCPLLTSLRPRRIILGSPSTGFTGSAEGLWTTPSPLTTYPFPPPFVKELVVVLGFCCARDTYPLLCPPFLRHLTASLDKVTFVLGCYEMTLDDLGKQGDIMLNEGLRSWSNIDLVSRRMCRACVGNAKVIEVVAEGGFLGDDIEGIEGELARRGWRPEDIQKRAKTVRAEDEWVFARREWWYKEQREAPKEALISKIKREMKVQASWPRIHRARCTCRVCRGEF